MSSAIPLSDIICAQRRRDFLQFGGFVAVAAAMPLVAEADQASQRRRVGVLMSTAETAPLEVKSLNAFKAELQRLGWIAGQNVQVDVRWGAANADRMTANARELVALAPDVVLAKGAANPAARQATGTIPIVFVVIPEAAALSYVVDFAKPAGNSTGFTTFERGLVGKRVSLLCDLAPRTERIIYLRSRKTGVDTKALYDRLVAEAGSAGLSAADAPAENASEIEDALRAFARNPNGAIIVAFDAFTLLNRVKIVELAKELRLPAIYPARNFGSGGGLCCYGFEQDEQFRQGAPYVARILAGARPAELPVQAPTKFELMLNLGVAKGLDLSIPPGIVAAADEVIE
jgi:putative ABC transport system substrate-binding protein